MIKHLITFLLILLSTVTFSQPLSWTQHVGNTNASAKGLSITTDLKGNVYTTGYFGDAPDFDQSSASYSLTSNGQSDVFVTKHDSSGNLVWAKNLGSTNYDQGNSISVDASDNLLITGLFTGTVDFDPAATSSYTLTGNVFYESIFILKLDHNGNFIWAKTINGLNSSANGRSITTDHLKNVYVTGCFSTTSDFDPGVGTDSLKAFGNWDAFLLKLDSTGNYIWSKNIGTSSGGTEGNYVSLDASENIFVTGVYDGASDFNPGAATNLLYSSGSTDVYVLKLDNNGNYKWAKKLGGSGGDRGNALLIDGRKNIYTTGYFEGTADFNPSAVAIYTLNASYGLNTFISKLDSSGNFIWAKNVGRKLSNNTATSIAKDHSNNIYITGCYMNTTDFDPGVDSFYVTMASINTNNAAYILKLDSLGNFKNVKAFGTGTYGAFGQAIAIDMNDNILTTGYFSGTGDFDPDSTVLQLSSNGIQDIYISKFGRTHTVSIHEFINDHSLQLSIFPNPNTGNFYVIAKEKMKLNLIDNLGQIVQPLELNESNHFQQNILIFSSGIYFISGPSSKGLVRQKIVVTQ